MAVGQQANMMVLLVIFSLLFSVQCHLSKPWEDPNYTPFPNMVSALLGYNLFNGDVLTKPDPGIRNQIFIPTVRTKNNRMELAPGITARDTVSCDVKLTTTIYSNTNSYLKMLTNDYNSGYDFKYGNEIDISAEKGPLKASATIPPMFTRGWSNSKTTKDISKFFSEKKGLLAVSGATCYTQTIRLNAHLYPPFTDPFKMAIQHLLHATYKGVQQKMAAYKLFVREFGTHFQLETKMGAKIMIIQKFSSKIRNSFDRKHLKKCSSVTGTRIFGMQVEADKNECSKSDITKIDKSDGSFSEQQQITLGSYPGKGIYKWADKVRDDKKPSPLGYHLVPIINLFKETIFKEKNITLNGKPANSTALRKWFVKLYWHHCQTMGIECKIETGCGYDDTCNLDQFCKNTKAGKPECIPVNICKALTPCKQGTCTNSELQLGTYSCTCKPGYEGKNCDRVKNQCDAGTHGCHSNANCKSVNGISTCECKLGYYGDGRYCSIDPCKQEGKVCHSQATCKSSYDYATRSVRFTCKCNKHYAGDGFKCVHVCSSSHHTCHSQATCKPVYYYASKSSGFTCKCNDYYVGDGFNCVYVCSSSHHTCHSTATCVQREKTFDCVCSPGYLKCRSDSRCEDIHTQIKIIYKYCKLGMNLIFSRHACK